MQRTRKPTKDVPANGESDWRLSKGSTFRRAQLQRPQRLKVRVAHIIDTGRGSLLEPGLASYPDPALCDGTQGQNLRITPRGGQSCALSRTSTLARSSCALREPMEWVTLNARTRNPRTRH